MKIALIIAGDVLGLLLLGGGILFFTGVSVNNSLVTQQESVKAAWSQVDIALQRRADLIPNLVETVKGYASHEKGVIEAVANARAAMGGARLILCTAPNGKAISGLVGGLSRGGELIFVAAPNDPLQFPAGLLRSQALVLAARSPLGAQQVWQPQLPMKLARRARYSCCSPPARLRHTV